MLHLDQALFKARIFHGLKSLQTTGDTLAPRFLEIAISEGFGFVHVGDGNFYADSIKNNIQASIKTRMINPHILKTKQGRDFNTHPDKFLGPQVNQKHNRWTAGLEIVQRRQQLDFKNDSTASAEKVGVATIDGFIKNIKESYTKFNTNTSYEIVGVHGYDKTRTFYIVGLFWQEYVPLNANNIKWIREGNGVSGYIIEDKISKKVCERVNGNAKREATCYKEFKDLTKYENIVNIKLPIPDPWKFNKDEILTEIDLKEKSYESESNLFTW